MSFGAKANFRIGEFTLDFAAAHKIYTDPDLKSRNHVNCNISSSPPGRSNYWIVKDYADNPVSHKREECYRLRMYRTYIHTWWEDGTYQSINWDSAITRDVLTSFGPVRVYKDSRCLYQDKHRFGDWRTNNYPYGNGIVVDPHGFVHGLTDFKEVLKPTAKKERALIVKQFRDNATSRIMLGEFGDAFAAYRTDIKKGFGRWDTGWMAQVPTRFSQIPALLYQEADNSDIMAAIRNYQRTFRDGPCRPSKDLALRACIETMAKELLDLPQFQWYEKKPVPYGVINVHDL